MIRTYARMIALVLAATAAPAMAAGPGENTAPPRAEPSAGNTTATPDRPARTRTLIFGEGSDIEGGVPTPEGERVNALKNLGHTNLIRLRRDFLPEIYRSAERLP